MIVSYFVVIMSAVVAFCFVTLLIDSDIVD